MLRKMIGAILGAAIIISPAVSNAGFLEDLAREVGKAVVEGAGNQKNSQNNSGFGANNQGSLKNDLSAKCESILFTDETKKISSAYLKFMKASGGTPEIVEVSPVVVETLFNEIRETFGAMDKEQRFNTVQAYDGAINHCVYLSTSEDPRAKNDNFFLYYTSEEHASKMLREFEFYDTVNANRAPRDRSKYYVGNFAFERNFDLFAMVNSALSFNTYDEEIQNGQKTQRWYPSHGVMALGLLMPKTSEKIKEQSNTIVANIEKTIASPVEGIVPRNNKHHKELLALKKKRETVSEGDEAMVSVYQNIEIMQACNDSRDRFNESFFTPQKHTAVMKDLEKIETEMTPFLKQKLDSLKKQASEKNKRVDMFEGIVGMQGQIFVDLPARIRLADPLSTENKDLRETCRETPEIVSMVYSVIRKGIKNGQFKRQ